MSDEEINEFPTGTLGHVMREVDIGIGSLGVHGLHLQAEFDQFKSRERDRREEIIFGKGEQ